MSESSNRARKARQVLLTGAALRSLGSSLDRLRYLTGGESSPDLERAEEFVRHAIDRRAGAVVLELEAGR